MSYKQSDFADYFVPEKYKNLEDIKKKLNFFFEESYERLQNKNFESFESLYLEKFKIDNKNNHCQKFIILNKKLFDNIKKLYFEPENEINYLFLNEFDGVNTNYISPAFINLEKLHLINFSKKPFSDFYLENYKYIIFRFMEIHVKFSPEKFFNESINEIYEYILKFFEYFYKKDLYIKYFDFANKLNPKYYLIYNFYKGIYDSMYEIFLDTTILIHFQSYNYINYFEEFGFYILYKMLEFLDLYLGFLYNNEKNFYAEISFLLLQAKCFFQDQNVREFLKK